MFVSMLKYMGLAKEYVTDAQKVEIAQKLLHQGLKRPELKDELYMQLVKQTRGNPSLDNKMRAWELFHLVTSTMPPSKVRNHCLDALFYYSCRILWDWSPSTFI